MPGKAFIDTNIVIYALGQTSTKAHLAAPLFVGSPFISTQVLSETANVVSKRLAPPMSEIRKLITSLEATGMTALLSPPRWKLAAIPFTPKICRTAKRLREDCISSIHLSDLR
jgi:predicted nucleic acid-binding protein